MTNLALSLVEYPARTSLLQGGCGEKSLTFNTWWVWTPWLEGVTMTWCSTLFFHGSLLIMTQRYGLVVWAYFNLLIGYHCLVGSGNFSEGSIKRLTINYNGEPVSIINWTWKDPISYQAPLGSYFHYTKRRKPQNQLFYWWLLLKLKQPYFKELDLTNPSTFRDLSKPMGAQTPSRLDQFKKRYQERYEKNTSTI